MTCVFCEIAAGRAEARIVYADEAVLAFIPLRPATEGHTLVVPRKHVRHFLELDGATSDAVFRASTRVGNAVVDAVDADGMNLITSAGREAEQTVFHLHVHLVPRTEGDGFDEIWKGPALSAAVDLDDVAERIRRRL